MEGRDGRKVPKCVACSSEAFYLKAKLSIEASCHVWAGRKFGSAELIGAGKAVLLPPAWQWAACAGKARVVEYFCITLMCLQSLRSLLKSRQMWVPALGLCPDCGPEAVLMWCEGCRAGERGRDCFVPSAITWTPECQEAALALTPLQPTVESWHLQLQHLVGFAADDSVAPQSEGSLSSWDWPCSCYD